MPLLSDPCLAGWGDLVILGIGLVPPLALYLLGPRYLLAPPYLLSSLLTLTFLLTLILLLTWAPYSMSPYFALLRPYYHYPLPLLLTP